MQHFTTVRLAGTSYVHYYVNLTNHYQDVATMAAPEARGTRTSATCARTDATGVHHSARPTHAGVSVASGINGPAALRTRPVRLLLRGDCSLDLSLSLSGIAFRGLSNRAISRAVRGQITNDRVDGATMLMRWRIDGEFSSQFPI